MGRENTASEKNNRLMYQPKVNVGLLNIMKYEIFLFIYFLFIYLTRVEYINYWSPGSFHNGPLTSNPNY